MERDVDSKEKDRHRLGDLEDEIKKMEATNAKEQVPSPSSIAQPPRIITPSPVTRHPITRHPSPIPHPPSQKWLDDLTKRHEDSKAGKSSRRSMLHNHVAKFDFGEGL